MSDFIDDIHLVDGYICAHLISETNLTRVAWERIKAHLTSKDHLLWQLEQSLSQLNSNELKALNIFLHSWKAKNE